MLSQIAMSFQMEETPGPDTRYDKPELDSAFAFDAFS